MYARRNEALARKRAIYHHEQPKTKAPALVATAMMQFKSPVKNKISLAAVGDTAMVAVEYSSADKQDELTEKENSNQTNVFESNSVAKNALTTEVVA